MMRRLERLFSMELLIQPFQQEPSIFLEKSALLLELIVADLLEQLQGMVLD